MDDFETIRALYESTQLEIAQQVKPVAHLNCFHSLLYRPWSSFLFCFDTIGPFAR